MHPTRPILGSTRTEDDVSRFSDALDDGFVADETADMMNLDTNAILAQEYWLDTPKGEVIDWAHLGCLTWQYRSYTSKNWRKT